MQSSEYSTKLSVPPPQSKGEAGVWFSLLLQAASDSVPETQKPAFLRYAFRWFLQLEGAERLSDEEVRLRKEKFYALLPDELRPYFPWETPTELPPPPPPQLAYPQAHTPFRQYGILAGQWAEALAAQENEQQKRLLGTRLIKHLYHQTRQQGIPTEETALIEAIAVLSGGQLRLSPTGLNDPTPSEHSPRPNKKPHRPFRHRR